MTLHDSDQETWTVNLQGFLKTFIMSFSCSLRNCCSTLTTIVFSLSFYSLESFLFRLLSVLWHQLSAFLLASEISQSELHLSAEEWKMLGEFTTLSSLPPKLYLILVPPFAHRADTQWLTKIDRGASHRIITHLMLRICGCSLSNQSPTVPNRLHCSLV